MANQNAKIDDNYKRTLLGVTDDANAELRRLLVDATTGRLKCSATVGGFTAGSIIFAGASGTLTQDNTKLFWDNAQDFLGIGTNAPNAPLSVRGAVGSIANFSDGISTVSIISGATQGKVVSNLDLELGGNNTTAVTLDTNGNVILGSKVALATNATDKFTYLPTCAGTPTGVPTAVTGKVATVYDTSNNKLYIYNGAWRSVTFA